MNIRKFLFTGYIFTLLFGSFCPVQLAAAIAPPDLADEHVEMMEVAMTPMLPMTLATPVLMISQSRSMSFSKNCQTGLCIGSHSNQQSPSLLSVSVQLAKRAAPSALPSPVLVSSVALPSSPDSGNVFYLAQTISTVVLRA